MILYGIPTCDTCRKAASALKAAGIQFSFVDVRGEPLSDAVLDRFVADLGPAIVNRKSTTWCAIPEQDRNKADRELLRDHPAVMKRPVIDDGNNLHLGWTTEVQTRLLG